MNPRRVHELMLKHFPEYDPVDLAWANVLDGDGLRREILASIIKKHISSDVLLVEAHRKQGGCLDFMAAMDFLAEHAGHSTIRITGRDFSGFVVLVSNGVAAGWRPQS